MQKDRYIKKEGNELSKKNIYVESIHKDKN